MADPRPPEPGRRRPGLRAVSRRGLAWLLVTLFVAVVAVVTVAVSTRLGAPRRPPTLALLLAAAVVTLALPRVLELADLLASRLVLGERADAYELVSEFVRSAAGTLDVDEVLPRLAETAARSVRSPRGEARVWLADGGQWREAWPVSPDEGAAVNVDVRHEGLAVGELAVAVDAEQLDPAAARRRLQALAAPAGLALSTVRLTMDLRRRLDQLARTEAELRASERRLIEARLDERQQFVGVIDGFVRPHLDAATRSLAAATEAETDDQVKAGLGTAARHTEAALERLRSLTHGLFPLALLHSGLAEALVEWGEESDTALTVHELGEGDGARRLPTAAAVQYFACVETLQALQPPPPTANVELSKMDDTATMAVDWSAHGPAEIDQETAVRLRDRVEAVGGTIKYSSASLTVTVPTGGPA